MKLTENKRRVINAITQGASQRGTKSYYMIKDAIDTVDKNLIPGYDELVRLAYGMYDSGAPEQMADFFGGGSQKMKDILSQRTFDKLTQKSNKSFQDTMSDFSLMGTSQKSVRVLMQLIMLEDPHIEQLKSLAIKTLKNVYPIVDQVDIELEVYLGWEAKNKMANMRISHGNTMAMPGMDAELSQGIFDQSSMENQGGESKVEWMEDKETFKITAAALTFPILIQELVKGLYEIVSLQGFTGSEEENKKIVQRVDRAVHEPEDFRYGKFIYDALSQHWIDSGYENPVLRELLFAEIYKLPDEEFFSMVENSINEELTDNQKQWIKRTLDRLDRENKQ